MRITNNCYQIGPEFEKVVTGLTFVMYTVLVVLGLYFNPKDLPYSPNDENAAADGDGNDQSPSRHDREISTRRRRRRAGLVALP